jgi:SNF2 family DNA or RNA helicase
MKVLLSPKNKMMVLGYDARVANIIPHALMREHKGTTLLLVPHRKEETRLLRNLGYDTPAPILSYYDWRHSTPFDSQRETAALLSMNKRAYVLSTMGCGKTRAALYAADYGMIAQTIKRTLIIAPLSTLTPTWMNELFLHFSHRSAVVLHGSRKKRLKLLAEDHDFYIINHDGVQVVMDELIARTDINCVVLDELALYRDAGTDRWKLTKKVVADREYVWGLTGAPTPNAPTDAYAQIKIMQPSKVGSFKRFRDSTMFQLTQFKWMPRKDAVDVVHGLMQPSVRYKLEDCVDIPETTYSTREVALSPVQQKFYTRLKDAMAIQYKEHMIDAVNEGVLLGKLLQVAGGWVYTSEKKTLGLNPAARLNELLTIVAETDRKIIVFVPYTHALRSVAAYLYAGTTVGIVDGSVSKKKRDEIFYKFQHSTTPEVIVAHPRTMSHGLTMTAAATIVWYSPPAGLDTYIQANARIARPGQEFKTNIIHLQSTPIEKQVYKRLQRHEALQGALLELFDGVQDAA